MNERADMDGLSGRSEQEIGAAIAAGIGDAGLDFERIGIELAERAERDGLIETAFTTFETPIGTLFAAATGRGLVKLSFPNVPAERRLQELAELIGPRLVRLERRFDPLRRQLDEYFSAQRRQFEIELDWRLSAGFVRRVLRATAAIPYGQTRTYAEMATLAGSPRAYRAAGSALGANPLPIVVPCHRVLRSGGALGGYGGGLELKQTLLELEGV